MPEANRYQSAPEGKGSHVAPGAADGPSHEAEILAGTPYRVLREIGKGGMGTIFEAEHRALGKRVVVKLLRSEYASEARLVERLKREARILARIESPHIVTVSDLGQTADGAAYIAMERLYGQTLGAELKRRQALPVVEAIHWTRDILAGLSAAHRAGVVHRDIKLDNIFLCDATAHEPRRIKLLDFGIAKVLKDATSGMDPSRHHPTVPGQLLGSPRWLAPEQARGKPVDRRADIYAVGLLLYTLVAGRGPFSHIRDPIDAIQASLSEEPARPSTYAPQDIPAALDDAILMAIEREPEHRFQSADAFAAALQSIALGLEDVTQPIPPTFVWRRVDAAPFTTQPRSEALGDATPATLVCARSSAPEAHEPGADFVPSLLERGAPMPTPGGAAVASNMRSADEEAGVSVGVFLALTAASSLFFFVLFALAVHFAGGR
jgi:eukaryotic-like serine/threonine-protein kinase